MKLRHLSIALTICALLYVAHLGTRHMSPAETNLAIAVTGEFKADGQYPGELLRHASTVRRWGSWAGSDENLGTLTLGPFPAPARLRFGAAGYPSNPGIQIYVERAVTHERLPVKSDNMGNDWRLIDQLLPAAWIGSPVLLVAVDNSKASCGWVAITEPILGGRGDSTAAWCSVIVPLPGSRPQASGTSNSMG
jgi:hypothetical protein